MSEGRLVPQIRLEGPHHLPPVRMFWSCSCCDFKASAMTEPHVLAAMDAHAEYVNRTKDRTIDEHFAEKRIEQLLAD